MRVSVNWLKDYLDIVVSPSELANRLMMSGNEVKAVEKPADWENVVIGQITNIAPHPNADRLRLATVTTGAEQHTVVCGAPNLVIGDKIAFASVGAVLKDGHTGQTSKLKPAKIRGIESKGMICSEMELGISQNHEGILVLSSDAPLGKPLSEYLGDTVIDLDVTPNRPDCLSIIGIAREAAALTGQYINVREPIYQEEDSPLDDRISVQIQASDLCPRYCASLVTGVKIKPSPKWMQDRLIACGMRPINNIVDISNYVMLEYGQPLHTFDYDKLQGKTIIVRRALEGETITSLDGVDRKLNPDMLVIADSNRAVAVAGVMGGANSEVTEQTTNILLEAASFKAGSIHYTGDNLNLASESRYRFERGIAPGLTVPALKRATMLLVELGDGKAARGYKDAYPGKIESNPIRLSRDKMKRLLGVDYTWEQIIRTLESLGFECKAVSTGDYIEVTAPYWRSDINLEVDLIEEVARIQGYDKIPNTLLAEPLPHLNPNPVFELTQQLRRGLVGNGFSEIVTFSLVGQDFLKKLTPDNSFFGPKPLRVANPMTVDMEYLRTTLRANVLAAFSGNRRFIEDSIRVFEVGKVYIPRSKDLPDERETLCGAAGGFRFSQSWQDNDKILDFYDIKGVIEGLLQGINQDPEFQRSSDISLHPNKQASILLNESKIGIFGEVHPRVLLNFNIDEPVYLIEIDLKSLLPYTTLQKGYKSIPRFPSTVRDLAVIVNADVTHQQIKKLIKAVAIVEMLQIFDVYSGKQVPAGKKSLAYRITYRSPEHTLTDEEVNRVHDQIVRKLNTDLGAVLRE